MPKMTGKEALAQMLAAEGLNYIFGNPGTSETPFLDVLQDYPNLQYIQALQEGTAVGMADGYARATGRPAFANIHIAGGLANGISALYNAYRGGTPLVLTAGNSDTRMLLSEPVLSGDLVEMTRQFTKWSAEVPHAGNIPMAVRRAFKEAKTPPTGPVFLSFPWDTMDEEVDVDITPSSAGYYRMRPDTDAVAKAADLLAQADNPVIVIGDRVSQSGAGSELVRVAEQLGAKVYASSYTYSEISFPLNHGQYAGMLNLNSAATRRQLAEADALLVVGANVFSSFLYVSEPFISPNTKLVHLDNSLKEIEKVYPTDLGIPCDPKAGLSDLADALDQTLSAPAKEAAATRAATMGEVRRQAREEYLRRMQNMPDTRPMPVDRMMYELARSLPDNAIIADEAITSRGSLLQAVEPSEPGSYYAIRGGALGWAMPGALGIKLANPDRPVVAVVGDGASMYTVQALWTAARYNIPVTYAICNNRSYRILKVNMDVYLRGMLEDNQRDSEYVGMDFATPLPLAELAAAMGVAGQNVENPADLRPALETAIASGKPSVVNVSIDGSL